MWPEQIPQVGSRIGSNESVWAAWQQAVGNQPALQPLSTDRYDPGPLRGAIRQLWTTRDFEAIVSGPADTGKTFGCLQYAHHLLLEHAGAQGVLIRKTYAALVGSAVQTFKRILGPLSQVKPYGGEKPEFYDYPNGSRLWIVGLDNVGKSLSTERDFICVNQAEELTLNEWETLTTRCSGRGAVMPFTRIFGECNPGPPSHWIRQRAGETRLRLLESRHEDNPDLFTEDGQITAAGQRRIGILDNLTGVRKQRLRFGKWVQAEGAVYEEWDRAVHLIPTLPAGNETWRRIRAIDFGYTNPFVCGWIAIDPDGRLYLYRQLYRTRRTVRDHAADINRLSAGERYEATVADHDAEDRATLEQEGIRTEKAWKAISPGLQAVQERLQPAGDGKPRLFIVEGGLVDRDEELAAKRLPVCTEDEMEVYSWPKDAAGKAVKEAPLDLHNHGCDMLRYAAAYVDDLGSQALETDDALHAAFWNR